MGLAKQLLVYSGILLGLAFGAIMVMASYLLLVPDSDIRGFYYVSGSTSDISREYLSVPDIDGGPLGPGDYYDEIVLKSHKFDINLYQHGNEEAQDRIYLDFSRTANGFAREGGREFDYDLNYDKESNTLTIETIEPRGGFILYNDAKLEIGLPKYAINANRLTVESNGGKVELGSNFSQDPMLFDDVEISNSRARMELNNIEINNSLNIENKSGRVIVKSNIGGDVRLESELSSFVFRDNDGNLTDIDGDLQLGEDADNVLKNVSVEARNINGSLAYFTKGGLLKVNNVSNDIHIRTDNADVVINKAYSNDIDIVSSYNSIKIAQLGQETSTGKALIRLNNGSIEIGDSYLELDIEAARGSVEVENLYRYADITTTYGDIDVSFPDPEVLIEDGKNPVEEDIRIRTENGNVNVQNLSGAADIKVPRSSDLAKIYVHFITVDKDSTILAGRRGVELKLPNSENDEYDIDVYTSGDVEDNGGFGNINSDFKSPEDPEEFDEGRYINEYLVYVGDSRGLGNLLEVRSHGDVVLNP